MLRYKHIDGEWKTIDGIGANELRREYYVVPGTVSEVPAKSVLHVDEDGNIQTQRKDSVNANCKR